ncbi:MAG: CCA tRNA nucleotidyltransferase [Chitinispirillaceae bacterium]|nr:CCA tRNA nucleotidyltransferase [Chitinispirillaceae bacterium]
MKPPTKTRKYKAAFSIISRLAKAGYEALFAGGVVRDMVMEESDDGDIDIATNARPETVSRLFSHTIPVGAQFGVIIVIADGLPFEVATFRSDTGIHDGRHPADIVYTDARNDALRRDFTINGLFFNPQTGEVIDYVGGKADIGLKVVRAIGDPSLRFREDYLRMLRAIRFAARFDFTIETATWSAIRLLADNITTISVERIFTELDKMLCLTHPDRAFDLLDHSGLLAIVLPEITGLKGVQQPPQFHPEGDVFEHTKKALSLLGVHPSSTLAWSVLLHDIGKPQTMTVADRIRFNNHDKVGMQKAHTLLKRFHASNALIEGVTACIANHMNFMQVRRMRLGTLKKFLSRPTIETEMELHRIDCLASHGDCGNVDFLKEELRRFQSKTLQPVPFLRGRDLVELGFTPGPLFGEILSQLYDMQLEEEISTREEAIRVVQEHYGSRK